MITRYQRNNLIKEFLPSTVMILLMGLLIFYALIPGIQHIQEVFVSIDTVSKENVLLKKKVSALTQFDEGTISQYVNTLLSAVPADKSIASVLSTIDSVAAKNNVTIAELAVINPGSISTDSASVKISNSKLGSNTIKISTTISGSQQDTFSFLAMIRKVRRLMRIASLAQSFSSTTATQSARTKVELEAFYAPLPSTLGKIETEVKPLSANEEQMIKTMSEYPLEFVQAASTVQGQVESGNKIDPFSF
jgi:hypothetical protein